MEKIGFEAVAKVDKYMKGVGQYEKGQDSMYKKTKSITSKISSSFTSLNSKLKSSLGGVAKNMLSVFGGMALFNGMKRIASGIKEMADAALEIPGVAGAFEGLGGSLKKMQEGSLGMVTDIDLMKSFNSAAQLVSTDFAKKLPDAMGYLAKAASATGTSMNVMIDSLVKGVGRVSPEILDNLGIQVNLTEANEAYAQSIGVTASELSKEQQQTAIMNLVMEKLAKNTADMPEVMGTAAQQMAAFDATIKNLKNDVGVGLIPVMQALMKPIMELANKYLPKLGEMAKKLGPELGEKLEAQIAKGIEKFTELRDSVTKMRERWETFKTSIMESSAFGTLVSTFETVKTKIDEVKTAFATMKLGEGLGGGGATVEGFLSAIGIPVGIAKAVDTAFKTAGKAAKTGIAKVKEIASGGKTGTVTGGIGVFAGLFPPNIAETIEETLGGIAGKVGPALSTAMTDIQSGFQTGGVGGGFGAIFKSALNILPLIPEIKADLVTGMLELGQGLLGSLGEAFPSLQPIIDSFLAPVLTIGTNLFAEFLKIKAIVMTSLKDAFTPGEDDNLMAGLTEMLGSITETIGGLLEKITPMIAPFIENILPRLFEVIAGLAPIVSEVFAVAGQIIADALPIVLDFVDKVVALIQDNMPLIQSIISEALTLIMQIWNLIWPALQTLIDRVWPPIQTVITGALNIIKGVLMAVSGFLSGDFTKAWDGIKLVFSGVWDVISGGIEIVWGLLQTLEDLVLKAIEPAKLAVEAFITDALEWLKTTFEDVKEAISTFVTEGIDWLVTKFDVIKEAVTEFISGGLDKLKETIDTVSTAISDFITERLDNLVTNFGNVKEAIEKLVKDGVDFLATRFDNLKTNVGDLIKDGLDLLSLAFETGKGWVDKFKEGLQNLTGPLGDVIDFARRAGEALGLIKPSPELTPGSPTPFELGLVGIGKALRATVGDLAAFGKAITPDEAKSMKNIAKSLKELVTALGRLLDLSTRFDIGPSGDFNISAIMAIFERVVLEVMGAVEEITARIGYNKIHKFKLTIRRLREIIDSAMVDFSGIKIVELPDMAAWADQFSLVVLTMMDAIQFIENAVGVSGLEFAQSLLGAINGIVGLVRPAIDAVVSLTEYEPAESLVEKINNLKDRLAEIVPVIAELAMEVAGPGLSIAAGVLAHITTIVGFVKGAVDAVTALGEYEQVANVSDKMKALKDDLIAIVDELLTVSSFYELEGISAASEILQAMSGIFSIVKTGIDAIMALAEYTTQKIDSAALDNFKKMLLYIVTSLSTIETELTVAGLTAATNLYTAMNGILGIIKPGVDAIMALIEYTAQKIDRRNLDNFKTLILYIATSLNELETELTVEGLTAATNLYTAMNGILAIIKPGVDAIMALMTYSAQRIDMAYLDNFKILLLRIVTVLEDIETDLTAEGLTAASAIYSAMSGILGIVKPAIESIQTLFAFVPVTLPESLLESFRTALHSVVDYLKEVADDFDLEGMENAAKIFAAINTIVGVIKPAIDALDALANYNVVVSIPAHAKRFRQHLEKLLFQLEKLAKKYTADGLKDTKDLYGAVKDITDSVKSSVDAIQSVISVRPENYDRNLSNFKDDFEDFLDTILNISGSMTMTLLPNARTFATNTEEIERLLETAFETIFSLSSPGGSLLTNFITGISEGLTEANRIFVQKLTTMANLTVELGARFYSAGWLLAQELGRGFEAYLQANPLLAGSSPTATGAMASVPMSRPSMLGASSTVTSSTSIQFGNVNISNGMSWAAFQAGVTEAVRQGMG